NPVAGAHRLTQQPLARVERQRAHVPPVQPEDVEDVVIDGDRAVTTCRKPRKAGLATVEGDHFAVYYSRRPWPSERRGKLREAAVQIEVVAREQLDAAVEAARDAADPVELAFEDPVAAG